MKEMGKRGLTKPVAASSRVEAEDRALVEAAQKDPARFGDLYELHFERVYAFVARRVRDRAAAEDLTSEVFHRALASLKQFEWRGAPFVAWLLRIAANATADRWKRLARENEVANLEDPAEPVAREIAESHDRARLFHLVDALPDDQRRVIVMRFAEEKSIREVAAALGRSEGAVKQLQLRGLQNLRAQMDKKPGERNG
jgi:RNA polymerase sigma-70 factor (ECF subfamily)